jgi:hypothetical protein
MCLQYISSRFTHSSFSLILSPLLKISQQVSLFYFHIWIQNTSTILALIHPLLMSSRLPLEPIPRKDLFYLPALHFVKVYSPRGFKLAISHKYISCCMQFNHHIAYSFYVTLLPYYSTAYSALHHLTFTCTWNDSVFFPLHHPHPVTQTR